MRNTRKRTYIQLLKENYPGPVHVFSGRDELTIEGFRTLVRLGIAREIDPIGTVARFVYAHPDEIPKAG